ncbi:Aste57867_19282 [Aphanomyces stellatus]|uniref:Aste57867_19282 protein n=1 Tax=Aphanomyces stellatus TaxID=120398 RepID=A0A485LE52_9STRA|nr:hypothetical protein As57867_019218 [Aphanomyces stellatus]VFT96002.1 Aste57867_19282 [Aphanomyces stellatus]
MANNRLVWYALVDGEGEAYNGTTASSVDIPSSNVIDQFRDAVKVKCDGQGDDLKGILSSKMIVYANQAAFGAENRVPLRSSAVLTGLGTDEDDALLVVVPGPATLLDCIQGWIEPKSLCSGKGKRWEYQGDKALVEKLDAPLVCHYEAWKDGRQDKTVHPLFMVLSGCGTGKSRMLDEMKELFTSAAIRAEHGGLQERISDAYVFNVTFENATSYGAQFEEAEHEVSVRMLYQLLGENKGQIWTQFVAEVKTSGKLPLIADVIEQLAAVEKTSEMTVILCVDGLQHLGPDVKSKTNAFYSLLSSICTIINSTTKFFLLAVCAATIHVPIDKILASSSQLRIHLVPPRLCGADIINPENPSIGRLVEDMDGHGRALEMLEQLLTEYSKANVDVSKVKLDQVVEEVWSGLTTKYRDLFAWSDSSIYYSVLAAVLSRRNFLLNDRIPGTEMTVDDLLQFGLFRQVGREGEPSCIACAFVVLWWMIKKLPLYKDKPDKLAEYITKCSDVSFGEFEKFVALYRTIKSIAFEKHQVSVEEFHSGATFGDIRGLSIKEEFRRQVVQKSNKVITGTKRLKANDFTPCDMAELDIREVYINATAASAADIFLKTNLINDGSPECVLETIQCKHEQATMSKERFDDERSKAGGNLFLLITTGPSDEFVLPSRCGIVSRANFIEYFGPFASRSYQYLIHPNINTADDAILRRIPGIGVARAKMIVDERNTNGNFVSPLNAFERLAKKLPLVFLEAYTY